MMPAAPSRNSGPIFSETFTVEIKRKKKLVGWLATHGVCQPGLAARHQQAHPKIVTVTSLALSPSSFGGGTAGAALRGKGSRESD